MNETSFLLENNIQITKIIQDKFPESKFHQVKMKNR